LTTTASRLNRAHRLAEIGWTEYLRSAGSKHLHLVYLGSSPNPCAEVSGRTARVMSRASGRRARGESWRARCSRPCGLPASRWRQDGIVSSCTRDPAYTTVIRSSPACTTRALVTRGSGRDAPTSMRRCADAAAAHGGGLRALWKRADDRAAVLCQFVSNWMQKTSSAEQLLHGHTGIACGSDVYVPRTAVARRSAWRAPGPSADARPRAATVDAELTPRCWRRAPAATAWHCWTFTLVARSRWWPEGPWSGPHRAPGCWRRTIRCTARLRWYAALVLLARGGAGGRLPGGGECACDGWRAAGSLWRPRDLEWFDDPVPTAFALPADAGRVVGPPACLKALSAMDGRRLIAHEREPSAAIDTICFCSCSNGSAVHPLLRHDRRRRASSERWADEEAAAEVADRLWWPMRRPRGLATKRAPQRAPATGGPVRGACSHADSSHALRRVLRWYVPH